jgi:hypothetical protein
MIEAQKTLTAYCANLVQTVQPAALPESSLTGISVQE